MNHDEGSFRALSELFRESPLRQLASSDRYVVMSDFHMGTARRSDDFASNADLVCDALKAYYDEGYHLILNGDIEELLRYELADVIHAWSDIYIVFEMFHHAGRLTKLIGNHDIELSETHDYPFPVSESLRLRYNDETLFVFHGHQLSRRDRTYNPRVVFFLKYLATPLGIKNHSVSQSSSKKFVVEKRVYEFSAEQRIMSIIGHTHRPLFESMSKVDSLRFEIERLCRKYPKSGSKKRAHIETSIRLLKRDLEDTIARENKLDKRSSLYNENLVVPCMFNSGTVIGKRGITCIEIRDERIALVHWFDERKSNRYIAYARDEPSRYGKSSYHRVVIKEDSLAYIFSRIRLLGGES